MLAVEGKGFARGVRFRSDGKEIAGWAQDRVALDLTCEIGRELRLYGAFQWHRDGKGEWLCCGFEVDDFVVLDSAPLEDVVADLRAIEGAEYDGRSWDELRELRG